MAIIEIAGLAVGVVALLPVFADSGKYWRRARVLVNRRDFVIEDAVVTFKIEKPDKILVFGTIKHRVKKHDPTLVFPITNYFGRVDDFNVTLDNQEFDTCIESEGTDTVFRHKIYNKRPNENVVLEFSCTLTGDPSLVNLYDDGLSWLVDIYRCKYLRLQVIFPKNFHPLNVSFSKRSSEVVDAKEVKEEFGSTKMPYKIDRCRKAVEWAIEYPKFNKAYRIGWAWKNLA